MREQAREQSLGKEIPNCVYYIVKMNVIRLIAP